MKFQKGNNLGGRTKGSKNKVTQEVREKFKFLLENNIDRIQKDLDELEPKDRIKLILEISKFVIPQLKAVELSQDPENSITPIVVDMSQWK
ncbi:hypothetical protein [Aestuariivivens sediminis]|uniref:hypothetical protein n=1 Tax=Aestuariivivens sediminis TaxID=2913557 RepID=UPI001F5AFCA2|nr:hypothetical protein [Aestuariivivens sediminis]